MSIEELAIFLGIGKIVVSLSIAWVIFYLLTKQKNPFKPPVELIKRPKWFLSNWVSVVLGLMLLLPITGVSHDDILGKWAVKITLSIVYIIPGFIVYLIALVIYKRKAKTTKE